ncbi:collagen-like protein, partial [Helicobacter baculiformis]
MRKMNCEVMSSICFLAWIAPLCLHALVIQTNHKIEFSKKSGVLSGFVVFNQRAHRELLALGKYQVSKNRKNILLTITHIKKREDYKTLSAQPSAIKEIGGKRELKKGTRIVLAGEDNAEIANLLGVNKQAYRSQKGGVGLASQDHVGSTDGVRGLGAFGGG